MNNLGIIMMVALIAGSITVVVSTIGLIVDHKRNKAKNREKRRQQISAINSRTILTYKENLRADAEHYRRRA
ncbi:MAG: hypothetical protein MJ063_06745 [Lachnospiraceae bacterium]|nr:hypothetical protein [Lachnospiraceae bacterium]